VKWLLLLLAACGDNKFSSLPYFAWTDQQTIGAFNIDHIAADDPGLLDAVDQASNFEVVLFYGHDPPNGTQYDTIAALFARAKNNGASILTFAGLAAGLAAGTAHPGICLSFDDTEVDDWYLLRPLLAQYSAHVSFMVTRYFEFTDAQKQELHTLYADGNSIEAHGVNHIEFADQDIATYVATEVQPSIDILVADGFTPVAYAHPGGAHTAALDDAIGPRIEFMRGISGAPK
jgi:Polysaccharide deacetylase